MKIDTAGNYTLRYTAEDECGNETVVDRSLVVAAPRTVLYTDGTFIINEKASDRAANEALHGVATNVYVPFDPNGATDTDKYIFSTESDRPWDSVKTSIHTAQIGSEIKPISMYGWFSNCRNLENIDFTLLDTSETTSMGALFYFCRKLSSVDLSDFNTSEVTDMSGMFVYTGITSLDLSNFDTSKVTNMAQMFSGCDLLTTLNIANFDTSSVTDMNSMFKETAMPSIDLSFFNTTNVTNMLVMFRSAKAQSIDLSSFDTSNVTTMEAMFYGCKQLKTIYATNAFNVANVNGYEMFYSMSTRLVGGAGTTWSSSNPTDKTYAHIDGGTSNPGYFTLKTGA